MCVGTIQVSARKETASEPSPSAKDGWQARVARRHHGTAVPAGGSPPCARNPSQPAAPRPIHSPLSLPLLSVAYPLCLLCRDRTLRELALRLSSAPRLRLRLDRSSLPSLSFPPSSASWRTGQAGGSSHVSRGAPYSTARATSPGQAASAAIQSYLPTRPPAHPPTWWNELARTRPANRLEAPPPPLRWLRPTTPSSAAAAAAAPASSFAAAPPVARCAAAMKGESRALAMLWPRDLWRPPMPAGGERRRDGGDRAHCRAMITCRQAGSSFP